MRKLTPHAGEVTPPVRTLVCRVTAGEVACDIDRPYTAVVVCGVQNSATLVDREVVGSRAIDVKERNLARKGEIADINDMDVATRVEADGARTFLSHECVPLLTGEGIVVPPHIVRLSPNRGETP